MLAVVPRSSEITAFMNFKFYITMELLNIKPLAINPYYIANINFKVTLIILAL